MKRSYAFAVVAVACALVFSLAACASAQSLSSPYEIAVEGGYEGTEQEWLSENDSSLSSARQWYEEAVADGYTGDFISFLKEIGAGSSSGEAAVSRALASVVSIQCQFTVVESVSSGFPFGGSQQQERTAVSSGSGVIWSLNREEGDALILTNYHVVYNASSKGDENTAHISDAISVCLYGGETTAGAMTATYVGGAMDYDIAVLSVEDSEILKESTALAAELGDSDGVGVGAQVYAVGNPEGEGIAATGGVLSVDAEYITIRAADESRTISLLEMRTDAAVNHGNSGGGLFDAEGRLIGIVNARSEESGVEAFGYAIPVNLAVAVAENILDNGSYARCASLGWSASAAASKGVYHEATNKMYLEETVTVTSVAAGSAAARAGIDVGDVIYSVSINGREQVVTRVHMLDALLMRMRADDDIVITVQHEGAIVERTVSLTQSDFTAYA